MSPWTDTVKPRPPRGITAIGIFLLFGAAMACLAGTSLTWRGTALDRMWALNPRAYKDLAPFGKAVGIPFLLLGVTLAIAGVGWLRHRLWGWRLAVAIIAIQVLSNVVHILLGRAVEGLIGGIVAGALLFYLLRSKADGHHSGKCAAATQQGQASDFHQLGILARLR